MRYAYYPGCVAKGMAHELFDSTSEVAKRLGTELMELTAASCCGAGAQNEGNPLLNVVLNTRTLAQAENQNLDVLTICSTCQGVMCQVKKQLKEDSRLFSRTNEALDKIGLQYKGKVRVKHLLWVLIEDYGLKKLESQVTKPLTSFKVAPFYGCYILRPPEALEFEDHEKPRSLEDVIKALGAESLHFDGETKCCGFPILFFQRKTAFEMSSQYLNNAKQKGADFMVTPCPLCHISLETYQKKAQKQARIETNLPVVHFSQLIGLALGIKPEKLGFSKHMVSMLKVLRGL